MKSGDDLPKDLTFNDPMITGRLRNLPASREPKPEPPPTPLGKWRDVVIGLLLLTGFFAALWAASRHIIWRR